MQGSDQFSVGKDFGSQQSHIQSHAPLSDFGNILAQEGSREAQLILLHALQEFDWLESCLLNTTLRKQEGQSLGTSFYTALTCEAL